MTYVISFLRNFKRFRKWEKVNPSSSTYPELKEAENLDVQNAGLKYLLTTSQKMFTQF